MTTFRSNLVAARCMPIVGLLLVSGEYTKHMLSVDTVHICDSSYEEQTYCIGHLNLVVR